jgi:hypothetical protein
MRQRLLDARLPMVRRVITFDGTTGRVVDTTISVARTLLPISERTYRPGGVIRRR